MCLVVLVLFEFGSTSNYYGCRYSIGVKNYCNTEQPVVVHVIRITSDLSVSNRAIIRNEILVLPMIVTQHCQTSFQYKIYLYHMKYKACHYANKHAIFLANFYIVRKRSIL